MRLFTYPFLATVTRPDCAPIAYLGETVACCRATAARCIPAALFAARVTDGGPVTIALTRLGKGVALPGGELAHLTSPQGAMSPRLGVYPSGIAIRDLYSVPATL